MLYLVFKKYIEEVQQLGVPIKIRNEYNKVTYFIGKYEIKLIQIKYRLRIVTVYS